MFSLVVSDCLIDTQKQTNTHLVILYDIRLIFRILFNFPDKYIRLFTPLIKFIFYTSQVIDTFFFRGKGICVNTGLTI